MLKKELEENINKYFKYKDRSWKPKTHKNNQDWAKNLLDFIEDKPFNRDTAEDYFLNLRQKGKAESSRRQAETFVKKIVRWMFNEGILEKDWAAGMARTPVNRKLRILPSQAEMLKLIDKVTEPGLYDNRQHRFSKKEHRACLKFILVACGGRNYETRNILLSDVSLSGRQVQIRQGKTGPRMVSIPEVPWLIKDLEERLQGKNPEELEILNDKGHYKEDYSQRLFVVGEKRLEAIMRQAGKLWGHPLQVHDLRRIFARDLKNNGAEDSDIKDAMGHANLETTLKYLEFNTATQQRTLRRYSSESRKYRDRGLKIKEIYERISDIGKIIASEDDGKKLIKLTIEV
ncbi:MAG TPA: site-specific integrase [Patescibacteria group bacterium]|nr:site-specific integrase [Patescibacteria group bacterium]